jgi:hypothetical protein
MACVLVGAWLTASEFVHAGPYVNVMQPCDCPPTHYSALHVLTPSLYRWAAWCQGPCRYTFAKNRHPETLPTDRVVKYHCPSINPRQFSMENYPGLYSSPPSSSYSSPSSTQGPQLNPPRELPPRDEKGKPPEKLPLPFEQPDKK